MKMKVTQSCVTLCDPMDYTWNSPGRNTVVGSLSLLQGSNPGLLHCTRILHQPSYEGSPSVQMMVHIYDFSKTSPVG